VDFANNAYSVDTQSTDITHNRLLLNPETPTVCGQTTTQRGLGYHSVQATAGVGFLSVDVDEFFLPRDVATACGLQRITC